MRLGSFTKYAKVKVTPTSNELFQVANPLGEVPKYVHIDCPVTSRPYEGQNGGVRFCSFWDEMTIGTMHSSNRATEAVYNVTMKKSDTIPSPGTMQKYYIGADYIAAQAAATASGRWSTVTEYTVHIYA